MVFQRRFKSFQDKLNWDPQQSYDYLEWALEGPPAEYFVMIAKIHGIQTWEWMLQKLEKRYGVLDGEDAMGKRNRMEGDGRRMGRGGVVEGCRRGRGREIDGTGMEKVRGGER